jgi:predicted DNA-binding transcriptional regulator AlpA
MTARADKAERQPAAPRLIPDSEVCARYGVVAYTLWRWDHDHPELGFPKPVRINGRKYRVEAELDQFDAKRAAERDADQRAQPLDAGEAA